MKTLVKGGIIGGLIVFIWGMVSWMVLGWHMKDFSAFSNESAVQDTLIANTAQAGMYLLPCAQGEGFQNLSDEEQKARLQKSYEMMEKGPFAFVVMHPKGVGPMWVSMAKSFLLQVISAFFVTLLLVQSRVKNYFGRVFLVIIFALAAGLVGYFPSWIWWGFPCRYVFVETADLIISWFLAGIVLAFLTRPRAAAPVQAVEPAQPQEQEELAP